MLATLDMFYYMLNYVSDISILPYHSKHGKLLLSLELQFIHKTSYSKSKSISKRITKEINVVECTVKHV